MNKTDQLGTLGLVFLGDSIELIPDHSLGPDKYMLPSHVFDVPVFNVIEMNAFRSFMDDHTLGRAGFRNDIFLPFFYDSMEISEYPTHESGFVRLDITQKSMMNSFILK